MSQQTPDFFPKEAAARYDERNSKLSRIADCLHFLVSLVLKDLPSDARILCAGAGTGAELLFLAQAFPQWTFVALDPSSAMLDVCRERVREAGLAPRCEFVHGYVADLAASEKFQAVLSILVAHFVPRSERLAFYTSMSERLVPGGVLVNAELSFDLGADEFPSMLKRWEAVQSLMGATPESLAALPKQLKEMLTILSPVETEALLRRSGIVQPVRFFQALMICGWYGCR